MPNANSSLPQRRMLDGGNRAEDRLVRRQLLVGPGGDQGAGALVRHLGRQSRAGRAWPTRPASTSCCRSAAGRATAATPATRRRRSRRSPGPPGCWPRPKRITVFGTVHAPLFHPVIAAKQMVTADHIGEGRFGLNIVVGWNEGEFEMFGVEQREHATRYEYAQDWIDAIKLMWSAPDDFDFDGAFIKLKKVRAKPKPYGGTQPVIMNAGASRCRPRLRGEELRCLLHAGVADLGGGDRAARCRREGRGRGARPRARRVHRRRHHLPADHEGGRGLSRPLRGRSGRLGARSITCWRFATSRRRRFPRRNSSGSAPDYAHGNSGVPIVGDPDHVARPVDRA